MQVVCFTGCGEWRGFAAFRTVCLFVCVCRCYLYCNEDFTQTLRLQHRAHCSTEPTAAPSPPQSADSTVGVRVVWNVRLCYRVRDLRRFKVPASYRNVVHLNIKILRCFETSRVTDQSTLRYIQQDINPYQHHYYQHYEQNVPICSNAMFSERTLIALQYTCGLQLNTCRNQ